MLLPHLTTEECQEHLDSLVKRIAEEEAEILDYAKKLAKAAAKGKLDEVKHLNRRIESCFESIAQLEGYRKDWERNLKNARIVKDGFEPILKFVYDMYQKDLSWHAELKADYKEKGYKAYMEMVKKKEITKTILAFAQMSTADAAKTFELDLYARLLKIQHQLEGKVGKVTEFKLRRNPNGSLDGYVEGTEGSAQLQTIVAGGYNIQRAHYRTLVK